MSAFDPMLRDDGDRALGSLGHLVLYEPNDRCDDRPSDAASNCARDGVARRAEAHVFRRRARCIATECTGYYLNYEIDEYSRHVPLPCPQ
jgi:hypothetical protein